MGVKDIEKAIASHKQSGDYKNSSSDEYLSGFMKSDRLMPVVTLAIYFGAEDWDAPMSKSATTSSTGGLPLALQRASVTARP